MPTVAVTTGAEATSDTRHRAGITAADPDTVHAVTSTLGGLVTVCSGVSVLRPLRSPYEAATRGRCRACAAALGDPAAAASRNVIVL